MGQARKIMLLGEIGVGKTSIANRCAFNRFSTNYKATIGVDLFSVSLDVDGTSHEIVLWDTDGEYGMMMFDSIYVRGASAACILSDYSRPETLQTMTNLATTFEDLNPGRPVARVCNKLDLDTKGLGIDRFDNHQIDYATSAKSGDGVLEVFRDIARSCWELGL